MEMNKKIGISIIGLIIALIIFFTVRILIINGNEKKNLNNNNLLENEMDISEQGVKDECTEEWNLYHDEFQTALKEVNSRLEDENTHYLIKNTDGYICIYYLDEKKREVLYKKTAISTEYLSKKDLDELDKGVEVVGIEEVNKVLEDFE